MAATLCCNGVCICAAAGMDIAAVRERDSHQEICQGLVTRLV